MEERIKNGYTREQLAELSGVSARLIKSYELKEREIQKAKAITLYQLARALGIKMEEFF